MSRATALCLPASSPTQHVISHVLECNMVSYLPVRKERSPSPLGCGGRQWTIWLALPASLPLPILHCFSSGVETSLAAASSGDRGALWWGPKSAGFYLGGKKGALWRGSAFCASARRFDVLRRLLRGNLRSTAKAGSSTHSFCARALRGRGLGGIRGDFRQCMDNSGARPSHCTCGRPR